MNAALEWILTDLTRPENDDSELAVTGLFVFIGAKPGTGWLAGQLAEDRHGFLLTGSDIPASRRENENLTPLFLETSRPGAALVEACGRHGEGHQPPPLEDLIAPKPDANADDRRLLPYQGCPAAGSHASDRLRMSGKVHVGAPVGGCDVTHFGGRGAHSTATEQTQPRRRCRPVRVGLSIWPS
jgi:hypothetical protein